MPVVGWVLVSQPILLSWNFFYCISEDSKTEDIDEHKTVDVDE